MEKTNHQLDVAGLLCPLPVLKTQKFLRTMAVGDTVVVTATDPKTEQDIPILCREQGYKILAIEKNNGIFAFTIKK